MSIIPTLVYIKVHPLMSRRMIYIFLVWPTARFVVPSSDFLVFQCHHTRVVDLVVLARLEVPRKLKPAVLSLRCIVFLTPVQFGFVLELEFPCHSPLH